MAGIVEVIVLGRKSYQKRREIYIKVSNCLILSIFLIVGVVFLVSAVQNVMIVCNMDNKNVLCYCGDYKVTQKHPPRNTTYEFTLGNGDVFSVPSELLRNSDVLMEKPVLSFVYAGPRHIYRYGIIGGYTGVSISTDDGSVLFLDPYDSEEDVKAGAFVFFLIAIACISLPLLRFWPINLRLKIGEK